MSNREPIRERWRDRPPAGSSAEDRAGELMRRAEPLPPLSAAALARVRTRLGGRRHQRGAPVWQLALAASLVLCIAGVVAAARGVIPWLRRDRPTAGAPADPRAPVNRARGRAAPSPAAAVPPAVEAPAPVAALPRTGGAPIQPLAAPAGLPSATPALRPKLAAASVPAQDPTHDVPSSPSTSWGRSGGGPSSPSASGGRPGGGSADRDEPTPTEAPAPAATPPAAVAPPPLSASTPPAGAATPAAAPTRPPATGAKPAPSEVSAETALAAESRLLAVALRKLRQQRDAEGALRVLDEYRAKFPHGSLAPEAAIARVDAFLALGKRAPALAVLDGTQLAALPRARELRVLRGELRAGMGRCHDAISDFTAALQELPGDEIEERALYGRGSCRSRTEDPMGARGDLGRYLTRFPAGKFIRQVKQALARP